jgi:hypothetical protein
VKKRNFTLILLIVGTLSCGSYPPGYAVWMTWEGRTRTFVRDRDFISSNCRLLKREEAAKEVRPAEELRNVAQSLGATAVVVETTVRSSGERTSFYLCKTLPSGVPSKPRD